MDSIDYVPIGCVIFMTCMIIACSFLVISNYI